MSKLSRYVFALVAAFVSLPLGCGDTNAPIPPNTFRVLAFSDLHFNPFYDLSLFPALESANPSGWVAIFQTSTITTLSPWGTDTNYPLLQLALSSIRQNAAGAPVILYTGDLLGHEIPQTFFALYCPAQNPPCSPGAPPPAAVTAMQSFTDNSLAFVASQIRAAAGNTPVVFAVGNIDSYTGYGPDSTFLSNNAQTFYQQMLNASVDEAAFMSTFTAGGYYSAQPLGNGLLVLGLNTNPFATGVPGNPQPAVTAEVAWLNSELASAQAAGQKVWLLMHVPFGADMVSTATNAANARTPGHLTPQTTQMMMVPGYQSSLLTALAQYPGVITLMLGAHTHNDEYRIAPGNLVLEQIAGISPCFGDNPSFKVFSFPQNDFSPSDYESFSYNLATLGPFFRGAYTFNFAYNLPGPLNASLQTLALEILANPSTRAFYDFHYKSGNTYLDPSTHSPWNPINNQNWPIFACGITETDTTSFMNCVNSR